jgi:hypothetical protein
MPAFIKSQRHWLVVERRPPDAPDLNRVDQIFSHLKGGELANSA